MTYIKVYQINLGRDENSIAFSSLDSIMHNQDEIPSEIYDCVFEGEVNCTDLEEIYRMFNIDQPEGYKGRSLSVSDVIEVFPTEGEDKSAIKEGFYYCDSIGFKEVSFNAFLTETYKEDRIKVVLCEPNKIARVVEITNELEDLQHTVGGYIEAFYPFEEEVCIVCNDEGKLTGMPLSRAVYDDNNEIIDIIAGPFFICDCSGEDFGSLNDEQLKKYTEMYLYPETFIRVNGDIKAIKFDPRNNDVER